jgi:hypothetical protein
MPDYQTLSALLRNVYRDPAVEHLQNRCPEKVWVGNLVGQLEIENLDIFTRLDEGEFVAQLHARILMALDDMGDVLEAERFCEWNWPKWRNRA